MNGKVILAILVVISGAVGYVFYSSSTSEWNQVEQEETQAPEPEVSEPEPAEPEPVEKKVPEPVAAEPEPTPAAEDEPSEPEPAAEPEPEVSQEPQRVSAPISLNNSDPRVKQAVTDLAQRMVRWLTPPEQIRKWVLAVDLVAEGKIPYKHSPVKYEKDPFLVLPSGNERYVADAGNHSRWDALIAVMADIPVKDAARYYREWLPLLERAYGELGKSGTFNQRFLTALGRIRAVGEPPTGAALHRPHVFYEYVDPELEGATPLTKWVWRLGPENMLELQDFARNLSAELSYR
ncbi:MAG TPA: hypothetical protein DIW43_03960 [Spongiibacteraceae bacterium]|nr:hypothetical protein [Spongiibacteraceae bacterium]HCS26582.1 hypothetical protein [Spongiibacteraceae bacterium]